MKRRQSQSWEKDFPLAKLIFEGFKSLKGDKKEDAKSRPLSYEEMQLKRRRESGFLY